MAIIAPFRALRYDPARVPLPDVVTQPYDKITTQMQEAYYKANPFNLVRIILGRTDPGDNEQDNVYSRAAAAFKQWRKEGIFLQDPQPSIYAYTQRFTVTGSAGAREYERRGFIALGKIEDYDAGVVFRHEQTLAKPKADRLQLLRATRAHFGQIFMLYRDSTRGIETLLNSDAPPDVDIRDEYGVLHRVWRISAPSTLESLRTKMADKKLIIADGHHRYETALTYRNERRAEAASTPGNAIHPNDFVMMTFVNMESEGVVILPTHRVVHSLASFNAEEFFQRASRYFDLEDVSVELSPKRATSLLSEAGMKGTAFLAVTARKVFLLRARPGAAASLLNAFSTLQQQLDVVQLHKVLLENVLGISEEAIRNQQNISYLREAADAMRGVHDGANIAFLMNPARMEQVRDVAFAGQVLPQKSTDFYPKLLSGLTVYALD
ncbi:MAG TPA: DUF1015 domain-containing protein [Terriglobales bacterium]|nr:DUF1015 domain-containing protein [Terriglobales bacterium]